MERLHRRGLSKTPKMRDLEDLRNRAARRAKAEAEGIVITEEDDE
jgi:hypothetical protein